MIYFLVCFISELHILVLNRYTSDEDFVIADAVFDCIGDPPEGRFDLEFCANLLQKQFVS
jgi:hypothetical protein